MKRLLEILRLFWFIIWSKERYRVVDNNISDDYHTFEELYNYRMLYHAAWLNVMYENNLNFGGKHKDDIYKSTRHETGELCFGGDYFIVVAILPNGQITNHYKLKYWSLFKIPIRETKMIPYDGHTPKDVITRLRLHIMGYSKLGDK